MNYRKLKNTLLIEKVIHWLGFCVFQKFCQQHKYILGLWHENFIWPINIFLSLHILFWGTLIEQFASAKNVFKRNQSLGFLSLYKCKNATEILYNTEKVERNTIAHYPTRC